MRTLVVESAGKETSARGPKRRSENVCFRAAVGGKADCQPKGLAALIYEYTPSSDWMPFASPAEFACALSDAAAGIAPLPPLTHQRPSPGREAAVIAARILRTERGRARALVIPFPLHSTCHTALLMRSRAARA